MKASELKRFQTYPRLGGHALSKKRTAVYARRWYWRRKLRAAGVPEIDLEDTLDRLIEYRTQHRYSSMNADKRRKYNRKYYRKNRERLNDYFKEWSAKRQREDRARATIAIGGLR